MDVAKRLGPFNVSKVPKTKKCAKTGLLVLRVKMKNKGDYLENPHNQLKIHIHVLNKLPNIKEYDVINYKIHGCFTCMWLWSGAHGGGRRRQARGRRACGFGTASGRRRTTPSSPAELNNTKTPHYWHLLGPGRLSEAPNRQD
jgi:hypothetical protein